MSLHEISFKWSWVLLRVGEFKRNAANLIDFFCFNEYFIIVIRLWNTDKDIDGIFLLFTKQINMILILRYWFHRIEFYFKMINSLLYCIRNEWRYFWWTFNISEFINVSQLHIFNYSLSRPAVPIVFSIWKIFYQNRSYIIFPFLLS